MSDLSTKLTVQKFNGYTSEDAKQFLDDFNAYCTFNNIKDNTARKVAAFQLSLNGPAKIWYNSLQNYEKASWNVLEPIFSTKYTANDTSKILSYTECFQSVRLCDHEKLETFHSKLCDLGQKLNKSDMDVQLKFIECLPRELAFYVRAGNPTTSAEALDAAKIGEAYGYRSQYTSVEPVAASSPLPVGSALEQKVEDLSRQVQALRTTDPNSVRGSGCYRCAGRDVKGEPMRSDTLCQLCGHQGHSARDCRKSTLCQLCNRTGHTAIDCYQRQGNGRNPSGRGRGRLGGTQ